MNPTAPAVIEKAIHILGEDGLAKEVMEERIAALTAGDALAARRLICWIPEAFGIAALAQIGPGKIALPKTFIAQDRSGTWRSFPLAAEPIYIAAQERAVNLFNKHHRELFVRVASRSTLAISANRLVEAGTPMEDIVLTGPVMLDVPAEVYRPELKSWWRRFFS